SRGELIGNFDGEDRVLVLFKDGQFELTTYELSNHYEADKISIITKLDTGLVVSMVHQDGKTKNHFIKRFQIETNTTGKKYSLISETPGSKLIAVSVHPNPEVKMDLVKGKTKEKETIIVQASELIDLKGWKAIGNRLSQHQVKKAVFIEPETEVVEPVPSVEEVKEPVVTPAPKKVIEEPKIVVKEKEKPTTTPLKPPKKEGGGDYEVGTTLELF
ncbi:Topoisomerase IV subunit A, partial [hydrothermal vent metagenome]